jgi:tetratricopeptide (TPR) repeat protein
MRLLYLVGITYIAVSVYALIRGPVPAADPVSVTSFFVAGDPTEDGAVWFSQVRPYCNTLEVETVHRQTPPPTSRGGAGYSAACWALAGRIEEARSVILALEGDERWKAAGVVFAIGHPIADMGDDRSAGPIMELVIEFWPNHYQALYHAGAARFALGDYQLAETHLREFLRYYDQNDGWTRSAKRMLEEIDAR